MKKIILISFIVSTIFFLFGCQKKATPKMIEKYEQIKKQNELFDSKYNMKDYYENLNNSYYYTAVHALEQPKKYYSTEIIDMMCYKMDEYYIYDFSDSTHAEVRIDFDRLFEEGNIPDEEHNWRGNISAKILQNMLSDHKSFHNDLIPGTEEWDLWMMNTATNKNYVSSPIINKKGKYTDSYKDKYNISARCQTCPFCIYKDMIYKEKGIIKEAEQWTDLYIFNMPENYWQKYIQSFIKNEMNNDKNFIKQKEAFMNTPKAKDSLPLYPFEKVKNEIQDNKLNAKEKYNGKQLKIKAQVARIYEDKVELLYGPYVFLPKEDLRKLHAGQYITFVATMKFIDYSSGNSSSSAFEQWARDMDDALRDLDKAIRDLDSGAMGYSFENAKLEKIEEGELPVFY